MKRGRIISGLTGIVLFASIAGLKRARAQGDDQNNDGQWDGPGYYAEDLTTFKSDGSQALYKAGGPFDSYDDCSAYLQQYNKSTDPDYDDSYQCVYRDSDPKYADCFLTTACTQYAGLRDGCEELAAMRAFRDGYLRKFEEGRLLIDHYYRIAPRIVRCIQRAPDRSRTLGWVLGEVRGTARAIGHGEPAAAIERYAAMVLTLKRRYAVK